MVFSSAVNSTVAPAYTYSLDNIVLDATSVSDGEPALAHIQVSAQGLLL